MYKKNDAEPDYRVWLNKKQNTHTVLLMGWGQTMLYENGCVVVFSAYVQSTLKKEQY